MLLKITLKNRIVDKNSLNAAADRIWSTLNSKDNINKSKDEQVELIKNIVFFVVSEHESIAVTKFKKDLVFKIENM